MDEFKGAPALDADLISAAQAVEHYEIARYGTLKAWAKQPGENDVVRLLEKRGNCDRPGAFKAWRATGQSQGRVIVKDGGRRRPPSS